jgi:hypothetical protein
LWDPGLFNIFHISAAITTVLDTSASRNYGITMVDARGLTGSANIYTVIKRMDMDRII